MPGTEYHFAPNDAGDQVAEVTDFDHIQRFLNIPEGYEPYGDEAQVETAQIVADSNELTSLEARLDPSLSNLSNMTMEELRAEYHHRFGRLAPPLTKYETLLRKLTAARMNLSEG